MGFQICDQYNNGQGPLPAFTTNIIGVWHHVISNVVLLPNGLASYQVWLDGALQSASAFTTWVWPQYVQRTNALLGRSNWNDPSATTPHSAHSTAGDVGLAPPHTRSLRTFVTHSRVTVDVLLSACVCRYWAGLIDYFAIVRAF